jgi:hypothetical protein
MTDTLAPAATATITQVMDNVQGPLPLGGYPFVSHGGPLEINASGSGFFTGGSPIIGMRVYLDGVKVGTSQVYANNAGVHMAFVPIFMALQGIAEGRHVIQIQPLDQTSTDPNDFFNVTVTEFQAP